MPAEKLNHYLETYYWSDAATYAGHLGPAPVLFQYATHDEFVPVAAAKHYFEMSSGPKELKFYDSDHALNAEARHDRYAFLRKRLNLPMAPPAALEKSKPPHVKPTCGAPDFVFTATPGPPAG